MMRLKLILIQIYTLLGFMPITAQVSKAPSFVLRGESIVDRLLVNSNYLDNDKLLLKSDKVIGGLAVDGRVEFHNEDGFIRITLEDTQGYEYLVYETYPLLSGNYHEEFESVAMESYLLNNTKPYCLNISVFHASLFLKQIVFSETSGNAFNKEKSILLRNKQQEELLSVLNRNIKQKKLPWIAGKTGVSLKSFEEKKKMFGNVVPFLYGFEYYKGGVFTLISENERRKQKIKPLRLTNQFVRDFDWRDRHGKNWITSVKSQTFNTCWAFASTATIESNLNLYYNRLLDYNLSEQELVSCIDNDGLTISHRLNNGGYSTYALDYVKNHGIVKEDCFPFVGLDSCNSNRKCKNPSERVSFSSYRSLYGNNCLDISEYEYNDSISEALRTSIIKHPVLVDYFKLAGHSVSCIGFHQIQLGDTLCSNINTSYYFVVDSTKIHFVDEISWIIKNSWGEDWGENGFARVIFNSVRLRIYELTEPFTSLVYTSDSIKVTDEDMDGYYFWGLGPRPSHCPSWVPNEPDGNDSDYQYGPMDAYGNLEDLGLRELQTIYILTDYTFTSRAFWYNNTCVCSMSKLTIKSPITLYGNTKIIVEPNGELVIDGGSLQNADIELNAGSKLVLKNGGTIIMRNGKDFYAPTGAIVTINEGIIQ